MLPSSIIQMMSQFAQERFRFQSMTTKSFLSENIEINFIQISTREKRNYARRLCNLTTTTTTMQEVKAAILSNPQHLTISSIHSINSNNSSNSHSHSKLSRVAHHRVRASSNRVTNNSSMLSNNNSI